MVTEHYSVDRILDEIRAVNAILDPEIRQLNLLHRLDKYRWAGSYDVQQLGDYEEKIRATFHNLPA